MILIQKKNTATGETELDLLSLSDLDFALFRIVFVKPDHTDSAGEQYDVYIDDDYIYLCLAQNYWKRIPLQRF